jgi:uncharacterized protein YbaR (Trm112 family)
LSDSRKREKFEGVFFIKYFWKDEIPYKIIRHPHPMDAFNMEDAQGGKKTIRKEHVLKTLMKRILRKLYEYNFDLLDILACPHCKMRVYFEGNKILCATCSLMYPTVDGTAIMLAEEAQPISK